MSETNDRYPVEHLDPDIDDGTMPENVATLAEAVVGHRIVSAVKMDNLPKGDDKYRWRHDGLLLTLDNGHQVTVANMDDCCAITEVEEFLLHPERVDHIITGVGTTDGYTRWHIFADFGDVLEMQVGWSCGNPFYYGYGFAINVLPPANPSRLSPSSDLSGGV
jgi:hypothetical protein